MGEAAGTAAAMALRAGIAPGDVPIPDDASNDASSISFATLIAAQSLGDRQALLDAGRRVIRLDLGQDIAGGLAAVTAAVA